MLIPDDVQLALTDRLRTWAAYHGAFRPRAALAEVTGGAIPGDVLLVARVLAAVKADCTTEPGPEGELWTMRAGPRREILAPGSPAVESVADYDGAIADAIAGQGELAPEQLGPLLASAADAAPAEVVEPLRRAVDALDRAGPAAPAYYMLVELRSALNAVLAAERSDELLAQGFFGREAELARISGWIADPQSDAPLSTLHISGLPGIGKSYLLEKAIQQARLTRQPVLVRLDFDRAALNVRDPHAFFEEISRQVSDGIPASALQLQEYRMRSAEEKATLSGRSRAGTWPDKLMAEMAQAVSGSGRMVLAVLDTLEVLRSRGETDVMALFEYLDQFAREGAVPMQVISAGRGDALDPVPGRMAGHLHLTGLEDAAARTLLAERDVPEALWPRILPLARGNPLLLALAGRALQGGDFDETELPQDATDETIGGYLYRAILSRVPPRLRRIANEGLILRRIDLDLLLHVVAPALDLPLDRDEAAEILNELNTQHWLVETDPLGRLHHRTDVRRAFLPLIYADSPRICAAINARAAAHFEVPDPAMALYHRMQLWRTTGELPDVPPDLADQIDADMLLDLADRPRDAVLQAQGRRSGFARSQSEPEVFHEVDGISVGDVFLPSAPDEAGAPPPEPEAAPPLAGDSGPLFFREPDGSRILRASDTRPAPPGQPDERAVRDIALMLREGGEGFREAGYVLTTGYTGSFTAGSEAGTTAARYLWAAGRWGNARLIFDAMDTDTLLEPDGPILGADPLMGRYMIEMMAEFRFDALCDALRDEKTRHQVIELSVGSGRIGLNESALELALIASVPEGFRLPSQYADTLARLSPWIDLEDTEADRDYILRMGRETMDEQWMRLADPDTPEAHALLAQAPSSYASALQFLSILDEAPPARLAPWVQQVVTRLPAIFGTGNPYGFAPLLFHERRVDPTGRSIGESILTLLGTARFTEALEGFAFFHPVPDVPAIAHAAERWRQAVGGAWHLGRSRPRGWPADRHADVVTLARARRLADHPGADVRAALLLWADPADPERAAATGRDDVIRRLSRRYDAALAVARDAPDPLLAALERLMRDGVTGVMAAPLAAHAARGTPTDSIV